ncbi:Sulfotransferase [Verrucomicrobia bacterium]|nr:Sulfotransferase [Verrucomicrobiota bacterium]
MGNHPDTGLATRRSSNYLFARAWAEGRSYRTPAPFVRALKSHPLVSQGSLSRLLQTAAEAWNRLDYQRSIDTLERAARLDPANAAIHLELGRAHGMRYDYAAAEKCFEKAVRVAPQKAEILAMAGVHCRNFNRYEMAKNYFERAIREPKASTDTFVKLAELYERFHFLKEAGALVDRALETDPGCALALLARARLYRSTGNLEEAERLGRLLVSNKDPSAWSTCIRGWYELGAILDRAGRYDEAMAAFLEAKALIRPNAGEFLAGQRTAHERLKEAEANISADVLRRWHESSAALETPRRLALLGGHPRSGTTLLEQVLDAHPDIISAEETSVFFETYLSLKRGLPQDALMLTVLDSASPPTLKVARDGYFSAMTNFLGADIGGRLLIDKNPSLTGLVPGLIRVFPEAKFLIALRDPRDVCLSCFMQPLPLNQVSAIFLSLEGAVEEYGSLMGVWRTMAARMPNPFLEVRYEDVVQDLESLSRRVLDFFGLPWDARVLRFDEHARQKLVRSPTYADVAKPVFKGAVGRWRHYQKYLEPWVGKLAPFIDAFGYA